MAYATLEDYMARYDRGNVSEEQLTSAINDVSNMLDYRIPDLAVRAAQDNVLRNVVLAMTCKAVNRYVMHPSDITQETVGPFSYSRSPNSGVYVTEEEVNRLRSPEVPARTVHFISPFMR